MNKLFLCFAFAAGHALIVAAQAPLYKGDLGKYTIEMELDSKDGKTYSGRYRYEGKKEWIILKGNMTGLTIHLQEQANSRTTGFFELNSDEDSLYGNWRKTSGEKPQAVRLKFVPPPQGVSGEYKMKGTLTKDVPKEYREDVATGALLIRQVSAEQITFVLDYNSGYPHYHMVLLSQDAISTDGGKTYTFNKHIEGFGEEEDRCYVSFVITEDGVHIEGGNGIGCGGGAYAIPDGFYKKQ